MKCAMQYAAIEFMPTTTSGNAHFLKPFTSITQLKAARNKNHWSKLLRKLAFLLQRAANPVKLCSALQVAGTPPPCQTKFAGATGYRAPASQYTKRIKASAPHTHLSDSTFEEKNPSRNNN